MLNPGAILKSTYQTAVSVNEQSNAELFQIWPNPASGAVNITLKKPIAANTITADLISPTGQLVKGNLLLQIGNNSVSVEDLVAGIYFLRLSNEDRSWLERVVVY